MWLVLPVLVFGFGLLLGLDDLQGEKDRNEAEKDDETGKIELHGEPPGDYFVKKILNPKERSCPDGCVRGACACFPC